MRNRNGGKNNMKTKKINGQIFTLQFVRSKKTDAQGMKKHIQNNGGLARIIKTRNGYEVYATYSTLGRMRKRSKTK
jgi:hypothetical protein